MTRRRSKGRAPGRLTVYAIVAALIAAAALVRAYWDYWPWFAAGGVAVAALWLWVAARRLRVASTMRAVDRMSGAEFERFLGRLFGGLGYRVEHVGAGGGDFGADLVLERAGARIAVQAKNYESGRVGNDAVQQAIAGASYYDCAEAMVVTNSTFTRAARQQAAGANIPVRLVDRRGLEGALRKRRA